MVDNGNDKDFVDKFHAWSLKEDKKLCDSMESGKENVIARIKQLEQKLSQTTQSIQQLSSYVDKVHASLAASSYSRFIEQEIADDFHQRATLPEGTIATSAEGKNLEGTILAFEVLRTAISVGIGNIAQLKEDIKAVSSVPDLISATPTMSGIKSSSEDLGDHTTIMRESAVEQEKTESDRTGVTRRLVPGESEMLDDAHTHTDLTPIPSATDSDPKNLSSSTSGTVPSTLNRSFLAGTSTSGLSDSSAKNLTTSTVPSELNRSFLASKTGKEDTETSERNLTVSSGIVPSELDRSFLAVTSTSGKSDSSAKNLTTSTVPSELNRSFLAAKTSAEHSDTSERNLTVSSGAVSSELNKSFLAVTSSSGKSDSSGKHSTSSGTVPSELNRSFLAGTTSADISDLGPKNLSSSGSGAVPSELDRSFLATTSEFSGSTGKDLTSSTAAPSELNKSFLLPTSEISGFSSLFKDDYADDGSSRRESAGDHLATSSSSRTVPSELDRSFLLPSSASDVSGLSRFLARSPGEQSSKKEELKKTENTSVVEAAKDTPSEPLCPKKITDKYKSIFDDEDDDDDLFDIKSKKKQEEVSVPSTKPPPKKLQESNFSKLLGEKLARGPVQPAKKETPTTISKPDSSQIVTKAKDATAKNDKTSDKDPDSYEPLHSIAKERTRGPARRPPSKRRTAVPNPVEPPTEDIKNLTVQSEANPRTAAPSTDTTRPQSEDVKELKTSTETKTVVKTKTTEDADAASKKTSTRSEVVQRSAVQSFFDADSEDDDKDENPPSKKTQETSKSEASQAKPQSTAPKVSSNITAQSLFADDDESDLSLFRKK